MVGHDAQTTICFGCGHLKNVSLWMYYCWMELTVVFHSDATLRYVCLFPPDKTLTNHFSLNRKRTSWTIVCKSISLDQQVKIFCGEWRRSAVAYLGATRPRAFPVIVRCWLFSVVDRAAEEAMVSELDENSPGTEWERVARLCDFNPKSSKQAKDVSRMRSVLISLKQSPLVR